MVNKTTARKLLACLSLGVLIVSSACTKEEDAPVTTPAADPVAEIYVSKYSYPVGTGVPFTSKSKNASTFKWEFGDSAKSTSTQVNPTFQFKKAGVHTVKLTASKEGKSHSTSVKLIIGKRYMDSIRFTCKSQVDTLGAKWDDDNTGPDIKLQLGRVSGSQPLTSNAQQNVTTTTATTVRLGSSMELTDELWRFDFFDEDGGTDVRMKRFEFNPSGPYTSQPFKLIDKKGHWDVQVFWHMAP